MEKLNIQLFNDDEQEQQVTPPAQQGGLKPTDALRDLSKHLGVNLFDKEGLELFKQSYGEIKTGLSTKDETIKALELEKTSFAQKEADYQLKIEALGLGFKFDVLDDVIALARIKAKDGNLSEGLKAVQATYGKFMSQVDFGTQQAGGQTPPSKTDVEKYMESNPQYQAYLKNKK